MCMAGVNSCKEGSIQSVITSGFINRIEDWDVRGLDVHNGRCSYFYRKRLVGKKQKVFYIDYKATTKQY